MQLFVSVTVVVQSSEPHKDMYIGTSHVSYGALATLILYFLSLPLLWSPLIPPESLSSEFMPYILTCFHIADMCICKSVCVRKACAGAHVCKYV